MPKITSVEPQKKSASRRTKRYNIFLDGSFAFGADEDLVVSRRLVIGKEFSTIDIEQIIKETAVGKLMEKMYRLFSIRQRSEKEVKDYFKIKNLEAKIKDQEEVSDLVVEQVIENLKKKGMINDKEFTRSWVEARSKKKGMKVIKQELFQKGIDRETIDEVISGQVTGNSEEQVARQAIEKKMRAWKNLSPLDFKKKAYDFLLRRGFEYSTVKDIIENLIKIRYNNDKEIR